MQTFIHFIKDLFETERSKVRKRLYKALSQLKSGDRIVINLKDAQSGCAIVDVFGNDPLMKRLGIKITWSHKDPEYRTVSYDSYCFENLFVHNTFTETTGSVITNDKEVLDKTIREELGI